MKHWMEAFLLSALLTATVSCTVKEDRTDCPCLLTVDISDLLDERVTSPDVWASPLSMYFFTSDAKVVRHDMSREMATPEYDRKVKKGEVSVSGILGQKTSKIKGTQLRYPEGSQADPVYLYSETLLCDGETARVEMSMYKQFSRIRMKELTDVPGYDPASSLSAYVMIVKAAYAGIDIISRIPAEGEYRCQITGVGKDWYEFILPRQGSRNVVVELYDRSGKLCDTIPVWKYLESVGYDWDALSLEDVTLYIDRCSAGIGVEVGDWQNDYILK